MDMSDDDIEILLEKGYIEVIGRNAVGDPIYKMTPLFYEEQSEIVDMIKKQESDVLNSLWFKGYIDLMMGDDGLAYIYLTDKSDGWVGEKSLTHDEKSMMYIIYSTGTYSKGRIRE